MSKLIIQNLTKTFPLSAKQRKSKKTEAKTLKAVDDLSLSPLPGEIFGLLGPNGAGKTTTLRMIATVLKPTSGKILYDGVDIQKDLASFRKRIGFLTSELKLDDYFTPNYTFHYMASLYGLDEETIASRKRDLFAKMGIEEFADTKIKNLSTGMKQKVSLAISLAHDPDIIIFDEPTNGLDIIAAKAVEDYLIDLKKANKTILISTHIFSLVEKLADRVAIILDGKKIVEADLKTLTSDSSLEEVFFSLYHEIKGDQE